ncbi:MAG: hypothetical protein ACJAVO_002655 [Parvibaculaceae bacterium]|jgi:hypothetical protein
MESEIPRFLTWLESVKKKIQFLKRLLLTYVCNCTLLKEPGVFRLDRCIATRYIAIMLKGYKNKLTKTIHFGNSPKRGSQ